MENMRIWSAMNRPPAHALKQINEGTLKGKSDINPQWRYEEMTRKFGPCGKGWKYEIINLWTLPGAAGRTTKDSGGEAGNEVLAFAQINLFFKEGDEWSDPVPGVGGSMLVRATKYGEKSNDEAFKMAVTDALSVAMKVLGVAADIYFGLWDGSKYRDVEPAGKGAKSKSSASDAEIEAQAVANIRAKLESCADRAEFEAAWGKLPVEDRRLIKGRADVMEAFKKRFPDPAKATA